MEERSRLSRREKSRSSESSFYGDDEDDEDDDSDVDEIQEKLDRILGSDSNSDVSYTPGKEDFDTEDEDLDIDKSGSQKTDFRTENNEDEDYSSGDSDIERIRSTFESNLAKKIQKPLKQRKELVESKQKSVRKLST